MPAIRMLTSASSGSGHPTPESPTGTVAVLLCSSDNTFDVGVQIAAAFDRHWPECPYPRFVLTTSLKGEWPLPGWSRLVGGAPRGWAGELQNGLNALPAHVRHILLVLDDFLVLSPVDDDLARRLIGHAERLELPYLRLIPVARSIAGTLGRRLCMRSEIVALKESEFYYSSLQLAVWHRDHLRGLLAESGSIWDFEHLRPTDAIHYAVARSGPISYVHVVERGRWLPYAARAFRKAGVSFDPGARPSWGLRYAIAHLRRKMLFALFGYSLTRLKTRARLFVSRGFST